MRRAAARRRAGGPLLHAEPLAGDAGDPQRAEAAAAVGGRPRLRAQLDVELLGDGGRAVGALVAHVDRVVLAVGADAPGADEPAPLRDAVLAQLAREDQRVALDGEVRARPLADAVEVDLVRGADRGGQADDGAGHGRDYLRRC